MSYNSYLQGENMQRIVSKSYFIVGKGFRGENRNNVRGTRSREYGDLLRCCQRELFISVADQQVCCVQTREAQYKNGSHSATLKETVISQQMRSLSMSLTWAKRLIEKVVDKYFLISLSHCPVFFSVPVFLKSTRWGLQKNSSQPLSPSSLSSSRH